MELPAAARAVYRFQAPGDEQARARWDVRLREKALEKLDAAAEAFAALTNDHPADADAWLNLALCRAWLGRNAEAIACLDRVVSLLAADHPERASDAWVLGEVLRQGGGAESFADDFRFAWVIQLGDSRTLPDDLFTHWPNLNPVAMPTVSNPGASLVDSGLVFEWLDRPLPGEGTRLERGQELPRVLASIIRTAGLLRLSSPDPLGFALLDDMAATPIGQALAGARREKAPLPIAWTDAALGTFRFPPKLDEGEKASLTRAAVEHYFENLWIHQPRQALGGNSPLQAARFASRGDLIAKAKLAAVIRYREQLGARATHAAIYQGYPFDRLRRRLGLLTPEQSGAIDAGDVSCMSGPELDELDPDTLDEHRLVDAFLSAAALRDDPSMVRFASRLVKVKPASLGRLDLAQVVAPLIREAIRLGDPESALDWLRIAEGAADRLHQRVFRIWSAEIHAQTGAPDEALRIYRELLELSEPGADARLALDGAETLLDRGYPDQALPLLLEARDRARRAGDVETLQKAGSWLDHRSDGFDDRSGDR